MDNEQKAKDLANKHLKIQGVGLPIRFNRRVHKGFLNAISEALTIHVVSSSMSFDLKSSGMKEYIFELERFEKTEQRLELDKVLMKSGRQSTGGVTLYDDVLSTFEKYMWKYGSTNIKIKTNRLKPQIYKVMTYEIEIVS